MNAVPETFKSVPVNSDFFNFNRKANKLFLINFPVKSLKIFLHCSDMKIF